MSLSHLILQSLSALEDSNNGSNIKQLLKSYLTDNGVDIDRFWKPPVDIDIQDDLITIYIDIPGIDPNTININFNGDILTIEGERVSPANRQSFDLKEIVYTKFSKKIKLPLCVINRESITSSAENGVLVILIDKKRENNNSFDIRLKKPVTLDELFID